ncbi:hypothetical protein AMAG_06384 [Allomyces macrogynus ATCC 38327]|uniref:Uncharacterized protein n=1 Tax=Allomyces macrogynus (strain ATCC 38327) TaxID=578462 RepID=A0A0L0SGD2_ALLM3|nr:hypothetical protein AMAG_06384 [Allomyces macrogynus ATCC 38327]|eukprot:KNE61568.1 hypothetical protein AMAG_06384 [Allomyces macrogynus ATCC 38327]
MDARAAGPAGMTAISRPSVTNRSSMTAQAAALQAFNMELLKTVEQLRSTLASVTATIQTEQQLRDQTQAEMDRLNQDLQQRDATLATLHTHHDEIAGALRKAEEAYVQIVESSQALLTSVKRDIEHIAAGQRHARRIPR